MDAREFLVLHSTGAELVKACTAGEALQKALIPGGYRHARAVIVAAFVVGTHNAKPRGIGSAFLAITGKPVVEQKP